MFGFEAQSIIVRWGVGVVVVVVVVRRWGLTINSQSQACPSVQH